MRAGQSTFIFVLLIDTLDLHCYEDIVSETLNFDFFTEDIGT